MTHKVLRAFGGPLQYSVFRCTLSDREKSLMLTRLEEVIRLDQDRVMIVNLGPPGGQVDAQIEFLGQPLSLPEEASAVIV
jgi:CRISPR-associated protein Cas2